MNLFVAGLFVVIGIQASITLSAALKPQRLERAGLAVNTRVAPSFKAEHAASFTDSSACLSSFGVHDFVCTFLSVPGLVLEYMQTQIGSGSQQAFAEPRLDIGTVSPRGPPAPSP